MIGRLWTYVALPSNARVAHIASRVMDRVRRRCGGRRRRGGKCDVGVAIPDDVDHDPAGLTDVDELMKGVVGFRASFGDAPGAQVKVWRTWLNNAINEQGKTAHHCSRDTCA